MDMDQCSSGFPARDLSCCGWGTLQAVWLTRSREVAKGNAAGRCSVFGGGRWASRGRESAGAGPGERSHAKTRSGSKERFGDTFNHLSVCPFPSHEFEFNGINAVPPDPYGGQGGLSAVYLNINANPDSRPLPGSPSSPLTTSLRFISENPCQSVACD